MSFYLHPCVVFASRDGPGQSVHMRRLTKAIAAHRICKYLPGSSLLAHVLSTELSFYLHPCVVFASRDGPGDQDRHCSPNMQRLAIPTRHALSTVMSFYLHTYVVVASSGDPGDQGRRGSPNMQRLARAIATRPCA